MRLIVGLGNPGPEYVWTPHNLGFLAIDRLAERARVKIRRPEGKSLVAMGELAGTRVVLAKPQTFMNASGLAVRELVGHFGMGPAQMIVITDDAALPWGTIRVRKRGSAGGHNGLKSVIDAVETEEFIRVRLGVGPAPPDEDLADYVLHPMTEWELEKAAEMVESTAEAVELILQTGTNAAMNRFNRRNSRPVDDFGPQTSGSGEN